MNKRFYAPSEQEAKNKLTSEHLHEFTQLANSLQQSYGPAPASIYLAGWVWFQVALAKQNGVDDPLLLTRALDEGYVELLVHFSNE